MKETEPEEGRLDEPRLECLDSLPASSNRLPACFAGALRYTLPENRCMGRLPQPNETHAKGGGRCR